MREFVLNDEDTLAEEWAKLGNLHTIGLAIIYQALGPGAQEGDVVRSEDSGEAFVLNKKVLEIFAFAEQLAKEHGLDLMDKTPSKGVVGIWLLAMVKWLRSNPETDTMTRTAMKLANDIGTKVWVHCGYGRTPQTLEQAKAQYSEQVVVDETRASWIVDTSPSDYEHWKSPTCKIDKKTLKPRDERVVVFDLQKAEDDWNACVYRGKHIYNMQNSLWKADIATLMQVARLIGYDDGENK